MGGGGGGSHHYCYLLKREWCKGLGNTGLWWAFFYSGFFFFAHSTAIITKTKVKAKKKKGIHPLTDSVQPGVFFMLKLFS